MLNLGPKQSRYALIVGLLLYVAAMAGLIAWLAFNGEDTVQKRLEKTPSVTITLKGKEAPVPDSWKQTSAPAKEMQGPMQPPKADAVTPPATPATPPTKAEVKTPAPPAADAKQPIAQTAPRPTPAPAAGAVSTSAAAPVSAEQAPPALTWQRFARPFDQKNTKPRISIIISDLGLASAATQTAVQDMPGEVTLAFSSSAPDLEGWIAKARAAGHESLLTVPMEPDNYPQNDPGPNTLLTGLDNKENVSRIRWALARSSGYVGVMPYMGEKFITVESKLAPVLDVVKDQGLMMVDTTQNNNSLIPTLSRLGRIPFTRADKVIDLAASRTAIEAQLAELEKIAQEKGHAVGIALPYPVTFEKLKAWIPTLEKKGFVLAPITAVAGQVAPATEQAATPSTTSATATDAAPAKPEALPEAVKTPSTAAPKASAAPVEADPNRINNEIVQ